MSKYLFTLLSSEYEFIMKVDTVDISIVSVVVASSLPIIIIFYSHRKSKVYLWRKRQKKKHSFNIYQRYFSLIYIIFNTSAAIRILLSWIFHFFFRPLVSCNYIYTSSIAPWFMITVICVYFLYFLYFCRFVSNEISSTYFINKSGHIAHTALIHSIAHHSEHSHTHTHR